MQGGWGSPESQQTIVLGEHGWSIVTEAILYAVGFGWQAYLLEPTGYGMSVTDVVMAMIIRMLRCLSP